MGKNGSRLSRRIERREAGRAGGEGGREKKGGRDISFVIMAFAAIEGHRQRSDGVVAHNTHGPLDSSRSASRLTLRRRRCPAAALHARLEGWNVARGARERAVLTSHLKLLSLPLQFDESSRK